MFHISKSILYQLKKDKILLSVRLGKKDLYKMAELEDTIAKAENM